MLVLESSGKRPWFTLTVGGRTIRVRAKHAENGGHHVYVVFDIPDDVRVNRDPPIDDAGAAS